jgi:putative transposase
MIDPCEANVSVMRQCQLLHISRSCFYYKPRPIAAEDLELMRLIDEQYLKTPSWGSRSMRNHLRRLGFRINRKKVQRLMRLMGLEAIYPKPKTSRPHPQHKVYPYLLKNLKIDRPNQVWAVDITYIPMSRGFMYLVAVMDWHSRKVLSWRLSNTLDSDFCVEAVIEAIGRHGTPEIFNTDSILTMCASAWMAVAASRIIYSLSACGGRSSINIFTYGLLTTDPSCAKNLSTGLTFTTVNARIKRLTI